MPGKIKFLLGAMFAVVGIIVISLFFGLSGNKLFATILFRDNTTFQASQENQLEVEKQESAPDTDGDGISDYEEAIYNADPFNPDTDGDGYLDGEEVLSGTDPLVPAPEDTIPGVEESRAIYTNITSRVFGSIFAEAANGTLYATNSENADEKDINFAVLENMIKNAQTNYIFATTINPIDEKGIKISSDDSLESSKKYILEVADSLKEIFEFSLTSGGNLGQAALLSAPGNFQPVKKLFIQYNQETQIIIDKLLNTQVPPELKEFHIDAINLALSFQRLSLAAAQLDNDPIKAIIAFAEIPTKIFELNGLINKLIEYADQKSIEIPATENYLLEIQGLLKVNKN